ncbi:hypothetical protein [Haliscomenobacter sp.]|uniref:hypothetical protein n=1 Tax=Haliscomenobacter sp. TaxID=2717303 RepID=UPI003593A998
MALGVAGAGIAFALQEVIANDNWVEFTLRYVVSYKKRRATKTTLFTRLLKEIEAPNSGIKLASATFHLVEAPEIRVKMQ